MQSKTAPRTPNKKAFTPAPTWPTLPPPFTFWETAREPLSNAASENRPRFPEAQTKINQAAREIHDHADDVSANWKLPLAVMSGLPNGLTVAFYETEAIGQVIKQLAAPPEQTNNE